MGFSVALIVLYAGIAFALPTVSFFKINNDAAATFGSTVILNNNATEAVAYRASERPDFAGAQWYAYSTAPVFVLSPGNGAKNVYFQIRNAKGRISQIVSDTIVLQSVQQNNSVGIQKDNSLSDARVTNPRQITNPLDTENLKENTKETTKGRGPTQVRDVGVRGIETEHKNTLGPGTGDAFKKGADIHKGVITGGRYGDTFGADRINNSNAAPVQLGADKGRDPGGWSDRGKGNAGKPMNEKDALASHVISPQDKSRDKNGYGGNTYNVKMGESIVTKMYDKKGNLRESGSLVGDKTVTAKWDKDGNELPPSTKSKQPNPMNDDSGGGKIVVTPGTTLDRQIKAGMKPRGQAGSPGDGRNPGSSDNSGSSENSDKSIMMGVTKGQEAKQVEPAGPINMNKMLEINTKINPGK